MTGFVLVACDNGGSSRELTHDSVLTDQGPWVAVYGAVFDDPVTEQPKLQAMLTADVMEPCGTLFGDDAELPTEFGFVKVVVDGDEAGRYDIASEADAGGAGSEVAVHLVHDEKPALTVFASSGTVDMDAPTWLRDSSVKLVVHAIFPKRPTLELECSTSASANVQRSECTCERGDGSRFTCLKSDASAASCCESTSPSEGRLGFDRTVVATFCPELCSSVSGLDHLCWDLRSR